MATMSPLRRCMIEDMTVRNLSPSTQQSYIYAIANFSRHFLRVATVAGRSKCMVGGAWRVWVNWCCRPRRIHYRSCRWCRNLRDWRPRSDPYRRKPPLLRLICGVQG
jgi:hypothetical protein